MGGGYAQALPQTRPDKRAAAYDSIGEGKGLHREHRRGLSALHLLKHVHLERVASEPDAGSALDLRARVARPCLPIALRKHTPRPAAAHPELQAESKLLAPQLAQSLVLFPAQPVAHAVACYVPLDNPLHVHGSGLDDPARLRLAQLYQSLSRSASKPGALDHADRLLNFAARLLEVVLLDGGDGGATGDLVSPRALDAPCFASLHLCQPIRGSMQPCLVLQARKHALLQANYGPGLLVYRYPQLRPTE
jgi:hypothetical protein